MDADKLTQNSARNYAGAGGPGLGPGLGPGIVYSSRGLVIEGPTFKVPHRQSRRRQSHDAGTGLNGSQKPSSSLQGSSASPEKFPGAGVTAGIPLQERMKPESEANPKPHSDGNSSLAERSKSSFELTRDAFSTVYKKVAEKTKRLIRFGFTESLPNAASEADTSSSKPVPAIPAPPAVIPAAAAPAPPSEPVVPAAVVKAAAVSAPPQLPKQENAALNFNSIVTDLLAARNYDKLITFMRVVTKTCKEETEAGTCTQAKGICTYIAVNCLDGLRSILFQYSAYIITHKELFNLTLHVLEYAIIAFVIMFTNVAENLDIILMLQEIVLELVQMYPSLSDEEKKEMVSFARNIITLQTSPGKQIVLSPISWWSLQYLFITSKYRHPTRNQINTYVAPEFMFSLFSDVTECGLQRRLKFALRQRSQMEKEIMLCSATYYAFGALSDRIKNNAGTLNDIEQNSLTQSIPTVVSLLNTALYSDTNYYAIRILQQILQTLPTTLQTIISNLQLENPNCQLFQLLRFIKTSAAKEIYFRHTYQKIIDSVKSIFNAANTESLLTTEAITNIKSLKLND